MYKTLYPSKDATLYSRHPERNTGTDQILEISKIGSGSAIDDLVGQYEYWDTSYVTRTLIDFDLSEVSASIVSGEIVRPTYYLTLKATEATQLPIEYTIYAHPVSGSWTNGTGYYNNDREITNGVSWKYRHGKANGQTWQRYGGDYYSSSAYECSEAFMYEYPDIRMDVSKIVNAWMTGSLKNKKYGFLLKFSNAVESGSTDAGQLKFFSKDTHTVYIPRLEMYWNDVVVSGTGSITEIDTDNYVVYVKNLKESYTETEEPKIRLGIRNRYPTASYSTVNANLISKRMPYNSYFQIADSRTNEVIIPFNDPGTRVSCDTEGNFIKLDMNSLLPERFYKLVFKIELGGSINHVDDGFWFKVRR